MVVDMDIVRAARRGDVATCASASASVRAMDDWAVRSAIGGGHIGAVRQLVARGANVRALDDAGFRRACASGDRAMAEFLLVECGVDVRVRGDEALRSAVDLGRCDLVCLLLAHGADIRAHHDLVLRAAVAHGWLGVVRASLEARPAGEGMRALAAEIATRVRMRGVRLEIVGMPACKRMPLGGVLFQSAMRAVDELSLSWAAQIGA